MEKKRRKSGEKSVIHFKLLSFYNLKKDLEVTMAYGFNDDKSKFDIDAAINAAKTEAITEARSIQLINSSEKTLTEVMDELPNGRRMLLVASTVAVAVGLPYNAPFFVDVQKYNNSNIVAIAYGETTGKGYGDYKQCKRSSSWWSSWKQISMNVIVAGNSKVITKLSLFAGRAVSTTKFRFTIPFADKILASNVSASGKIYVGCQGVGADIALNAQSGPGFEYLYSNTTTCTIDTATNTVTVIVTLDNATDLIRKDFAIFVQTYSAISEQLTLTFS